MKWTTLAIIFILAGILMIAGAFISYDFAITKFDTTEYVTNTYVLQEDFSNIRINSNTADINFELSDDEESKVVCYEQKKVTHFAEITDGDLIIGVNDSRKWYDYIGISIDSPKLTVYIPEGEYGDLTVKTDTGDVTIPSGFVFKNVNISGDTGSVTNNAHAIGTIKARTDTGRINMADTSAGAMDIRVSTGKVTLSGITCENNMKIDVNTGKVHLSNITCKNFISDGNTGDLTMKNVIAEDKFSIERDTGDIEFDKCDAAVINIETDTGDIEGTLLSDKIFLVESDHSKVDVPESFAGGKCKIDTDTGDVKIRIFR